MQKLISKLALYAALIVFLCLASFWSSVLAQRRFNQGQLIKITGSPFKTQTHFDSNGDVLICGAFIGTITIGSTTLTGTPALTELFLAKFSKEGSFKWAIKKASFEPEALTTDKNNNIYLTGGYGLELAVLKFSPTGNLVYDKVFQSPFTEEGCSIIGSCIRYSNE
jgi:hypothetical protein